MRDGNVIDLGSRRNAGTFGDVWQVAAVLAPEWVDDGDGPYRPMAVVAASGRTGVVGTSTLERPPLKLAKAVGEAIGHLVGEAGDEPVGFEVDDPAIGRAISRSRRWRELPVQERAVLPAVREFYERLRDHLTRDVPWSPLESGADVTVERVRGFAQAFMAFLEAAPWQLFGNGDVITIESPRPHADIGCCTVMGAVGEQFGVLAPPSAEALEAFLQAHEAGDDLPAPLWSASLSPPWQIPIRDHDLWLTEGLPTSLDGEVPVPMAMLPGGEVQRPDGAMLVFFEALLRALAATDRAAAESGRWSCELVTADGRQTVILSLPELDDELVADILALDEDEEDDEGAFDDDEYEIPSFDDPEGRAWLYSAAALETEGMLQWRLAREALRLDPDSPQGHRVLAAATSDPEERVTVLERGLAAAARRVGAEALVEFRGRLTELNGGRTYLLLRLELADALAAAGRPELAIAHDRELLELDEMDRMQARWALVGHLLQAGRDREAAEQLERDAGDELSCVWQYNRALVRFRCDGDGAASRRALASALDGNQHVCGILVGDTGRGGERASMYQLGSFEEAFMYCARFGPIWHETPGAVAWLQAGAARRRARGSGGGRRNPRRRRG